ncbi:MAG TPA: PTS sugar transporter subunit IIA [Gemmatimonadales bacterium]|jgi:PTS system nitrogen regulatory IIA component
MQLTIRQTASYFGVGEGEVRRWVAERDLPVHRVNERLHLNAIEVWEWAVERGIPVSRSLLDEARRAPEAIPSLASLLSTGGIHREVEGKDKSAVLASIVARLPLPDEVDREHLLAVLEAREAMGSTGIGGGIAIPHVRNPILLHVERPLVALFLLRHPVDFESIDGRPVHAVFLVVSSSIPVHLRILAELGFALRDPRLRELLLDRAPDQAILDRLADLADQTTGQYRAQPAS